jgi:hypothetical protein
MGQPALYDDDILIWSEEQADIIRRLGRTRSLPNDFDVENVAEEIESVGRSELAAVESQLQNILAHLIKLVADSKSDAVRHWQGEISGFHSEIIRRYVPSMRQRIDMQKLWRMARDQAVFRLAEGSPVAATLPEAVPLSLEELLAEKVDSIALAAAIIERMEEATNL